MKGDKVMAVLEEPILLDITGRDIVNELAGIKSMLSKNIPIVYGFYINGSESDPSACVTYVKDAIGATPAKMNYTTDTFEYGSWQGAFFMPRPCILAQDGTVMKYLNPNDYTKDIDGNTVTIDSGLAGANVMIEWPKIWMRIIPTYGDSYSGTVLFSNQQVDPYFNDFPYINYQGIHKDHFYTAAYNGSVSSSVMRSISDAQVSNKLTAQGEVNAATANGNGWYTETLSQIQLINMLLVLMSKSTNTQAVFGQGLNTSGTEAINNDFRTGVHNTRGLFYGTNSGATATYTNAVKVFGMENWWGFQWRRYAGHIVVNGQQKIKLSYDTSDGSTVTGYNGGSTWSTTGTGYIEAGDVPSGTSGGYINKMTFDDISILPSTASGSSTTYYCDGLWFNNSATTYAIRGGGSAAGAPVGAFSVAVYGGPGYADWGIGAALSYV